MNQSDSTSTLIERQKSHFLKLQNERFFVYDDRKKTQCVNLIRCTQETIMEGHSGPMVSCSTVFNVSCLMRS